MILNIFVNRYTIPLFLLLFSFVCAVLTQSFSILRLHVNESNETMRNIRMIKTLKVPREMLLSFSGESPINTCGYNECFLPETLSFWRVNSCNVSKYSVHTESFESLSLGFNISEYRTKIRRSQYQILDRNWNRFGVILKSCV